MSESPSSSPENTYRVQPSEPAVQRASSRGRTGGMRACPNCGGSVSAHASVCPTCGEGLKDRAGTIRCRFCGERSPAELTICPNCGRELAAAPPRIVTWGIPIALALLFLVVIARQVETHNPLAWAQERLTIQGFAADEQDKRLMVVMTPVVNEGTADSSAVAGQPTAVVSALAVNLDTEELAATQAEVNRVANVSDAEVKVAESVSGQVEQQQLSNADAGMIEFGGTGGSVEIQPADILTDSSADGSNATVSDATHNESNISGTTNGETLENEPEPAEVVEPAAISQTAEVGETSDVERAQQQDELDVPATATIQAPQDAPDQEESLLASVASVAKSAQVAQVELSVPTPTATNTMQPTPLSTATSAATPTMTPLPTATLVPMPKYTIRQGDTMVVIAQRNDVTVDDLMRANAMTAADAMSLQPGQEIVIPVEGSAGALDPTATPTSTAVPTEVIPPTNTPAPTATTPALRLDAPILRSPEPGTPMSCSTPGTLTWLPVPFMRADDVFVLHLGYVNGTNANGEDTVQWVLEQPSAANNTSWGMDTGLCSLSSQEHNREWHWWVEVAENVGGTYVPVSPPSEVWQFTWN